jgi:hypothetical protein
LLLIKPAKLLLFSTGADTLLAKLQEECYMKQRRILCKACVFLLCLSAGYVVQGGQVIHQPQKTDGDAVSAAKPVVSHAKLPMSFEANQGQTDKRVKFLSRGPGYTLFLTGDEVPLELQEAGAKSQDSRTRAEPLRAMSLLQSPKDRGPRTTDKGRRTTGSVLRLKLVDANQNAAVTGASELPGKSNYFIGNDRTKWRTNVPTYAKVKYEGVYPGVDLVFYGNQRHLEYDFVVAPGADPSAIALAVGAVREPPRAHRDAPLQIAADGDLVIPTEGGEVRLQKPLIYQESSGTRREILGGYVLKGAREVAFKVGAYDPTKSLVIDPTLAYSTYLGSYIGDNFDQANSVAADSSGNAYVTGWTESSNFPTTAGAFQTSLGGPDATNAFVTKLNPTGTALVYSTYLGGSSYDYSLGISVDSSGHAYVTGIATSSNFPTTTGAFQTSFASTAYPAGSNAFVTKLNPSGSALVYSTYLGGSNEDWGNGIAVDSSGDAYVTGISSSWNFPTTAGAFQTSLTGYSNAFITKLNPSGSALVYSTYLGGSFADVGYGIAVDSSGHAYVTGNTQSTSFPTTPGAFQTSLLAHYGNAFVTKLDPTGSALVYSTYLGGSGTSYCCYGDIAQGVAVDSLGHAYVTGGTVSSNFPTTAGAFQSSLASTVANGSNAFITELNPTGSALLYSTYLGGSSNDYGYGIAVDSSRNAYVTGYATSDNFPTTADAFDTYKPEVCTVCPNAFVTKLNPNGSALVYSTYLGGDGADIGLGIAVDLIGNTYVTGSTSSSNFPTTTGAFQTSRAGYQSAFVAKLATTTQAQIVDLERSVQALVSTGFLTPGEGQSLLAPLSATMAAVAHGNDDTAIGELNTFITRVQSMVSGDVLSSTEGSFLIDAANSIITALGG